MIKKLGIAGIMVIAVLGCNKDLERHEYSKEKYDYITELKNNRRIVIKDGKQGVLDEKNREIIPIDYEQINIIDDKILTVKDKKMDIRDLGGKSILSKEYDYIFPKDKLFLINKDGKYGLLDSKEKILVEPQYDRIEKFVKGLAVVQKNERFGVIDITGKEIVPPKYFYIKDFSNDMALVITEDMTGGFINSQGKEITPFKYKYTEDFKGESTLVVLDKSFGVIDKKGDYVIPLQEGRINYVGENLYSVKAGDKFYLTNTSNKRVIESGFDSIGILQEGLIIVKNNGKFGYIDRYGKIVIPLEYDEIGEIKGGRILAKDNRTEKFGLLDIKNTFVVNPQYDYISDRKGEFLIVGNSEAKEGVINKDGKVLLPLEYENLIFRNGKVIQGEKNGINKTIVLTKNSGKELNLNWKNVINLGENEIITKENEKIIVYKLN